MSAIDDLAHQPYLLLTTFRRSGVGVATPVWAVRDGDTLLVTTIVSSGKVKRLRNDGRVLLTPCDRAGGVAEGAASVTGVAEVHDDSATLDRLAELFEAKYGERFLEIRAARQQKRPELSSVALRITVGGSA